MRPWVAVLILLASARLVAAPPPLEKTPEFRFAKGLAHLGYYDLAAERFLLLKKGLKPPDPNYFRVTLALVEAYAGAAAQARKPQDQLDLSARAVAELEGLIQAQTDPDQRNLLRYRLGKQLLERGRLATEILSRKPRDLDAATLRDTARKALERAMATLQEVAAAQGKIVQAIEEKAKKGLSNADRRRRAFAAEQQLIAETEIGWTHFRLAKLWAEAGDAAARKAALENAVKVFTKVSQAHADTVAGIFSLLGRGQALEELGQLDAALEAYRGVLEVTRDETVAPMQQYALLYRARVLRRQGKFPKAVASLEALETLARKMPRSRVPRPWAPTATPSAPRPPNWRRRTPPGRDCAPRRAGGPIGRPSNVSSPLRARAAFTARRPTASWAAGSPTPVPAANARPNSGSPRGKPCSTAARCSRPWRPTGAPSP